MEQPLSNARKFNNFVKGKLLKKYSGNSLLDLAFLKYFKNQRINIHL